MFRDIHPSIRLFWEGRCTPGAWHDLRRRVYDTQLVYISEGTVRLELEERLHTLPQGSLTLIPPGYAHESWVEEGESAVRHCVHFDWTVENRKKPVPVEAYMDETFDDKLMHTVPGEAALYLPLLLTPDEVAPLIPTLEHFLAEARAESGVADLLLWPILQFALQRAKGKLAVPLATSRTGRMVANLRQYLVTHYQEPVGYDDFTRITGLSKPYLCTAFKAMIGCPPTDYLTKIRMQNAAELLRSGCNMKVSEVGDAVGIPDANYFSRVFRKHFGASPRCFRMRHGTTK
jgi:AraC-like DNA-binding protein